MDVEIEGGMNGLLLLQQLPANHAKHTTDVMLTRMHQTAPTTTAAEEEEQSAISS
jgi:hypothetical protein